MPFVEANTRFIIDAILTNKGWILDPKINVDNGLSIPQLTVPDFKTTKIPLPPLEIQQEIVARIEEEKTYIDGCKKLIEMYQEKIKKVIDGVIGGEDGK